MVEIDVIEQKPLTMVELKSKFDSIKKDNKELNFRATKVDAYLSDFVSLDLEKIKDLYQKLDGLGLRLRDRHIVKILDTMPSDVETLKVLFSGEALSLKQEELKKIVDMISN